MKMDLVLELSDIPGQLISVLKPFSDLGSNLVTVIHQRDIRNEAGLIPVQITVEGERDNLNKSLDLLSEMGISVLEIDGNVQKERMSTILIGHVVDTDVRDTVDRLNELDGVSVVGLEVKFVNEEKSSALITVEMDFELKEKVISRFKEIANSKDLLMINEV